MAEGLRFDGRVVLVTGAGGGEQRRHSLGCGVTGVSSPWEASGSVAELPAEGRAELTPHSRRCPDRCLRFLG